MDEYRDDRFARWRMILNDAPAVCAASMPIALLYLTGLAFYVYDESGLDSLQNALAVTPACCFGRLWLWQLITHPLLHGLNPLHPALPLLLLWTYGREVEHALGARRFIVCLLLSAAGTGVLIAATAWLMGAPEAMYIGSCGAAAGALGAYATLYPERMVKFLFVVRMHGRHAALLSLLLLVLAAKAGETSWPATALLLLGFPLGVLFVRHEASVADVVMPLYRRVAERRKRRERRVRLRVEELLEKVNRDGIESLTHRERAFLKRASRQYRERMTHRD